jgi:hypothetical protein
MTFPYALADLHGPDSGIECALNESGEWFIRHWPTALGTEPNQTALDAIVSAYEAKMAVPTSITKRQLIIQCAADEWISESEATAWATSNTLPTILEGVIAAMPSEDRFAARIQALSLTGALIDDPLMVAVATAAEADQDDINAFFTAAAAL